MITDYTYTVDWLERLACNTDGTGSSFHMWVEASTQAVNYLAGTLSKSFSHNCTMPSMFSLRSCTEADWVLKPARAKKFLSLATNFSFFRQKTHDKQKSHTNIQGHRFLTSTL